jgi:hypothetical protein
MTALVVALLLQDPGRSLYVWEEAKGVAEGKPGVAAELLKFCAGKRVDRLYFMFAGKDTPPLRDFVKAAREAKVQVHAMHPGDMAEWLDAFPARFDHAVVVDWARAAAALGLFDGIHLDVEPHGTEHWAKHRKELAAGYLELVRQVREATKGVVLSAAVPHNWDAVEVDGKTLIRRTQDLLDAVSVMAYRGKNPAKAIEAIEAEWMHRPGKVELLLETDTKVVEEGVALHVGTEANLEAIFKAARERFGPTLRCGVHHYATWRVLPER